MSLIASQPRARALILWVVQLFVSSFNYCTLLVNGTNFARFLHSFFSQSAPEPAASSSLAFYKAVTICLVLLLMVSIRSSAYLKIPSLVSTAVIIVSLVIFWAKNSLEIGFANAANMRACVWANALPLISSQVYSVESIGTLLTIRQAMKRPFDMGLVIRRVFLTGLGLFLANGLSFYSSFTDPAEMAFLYYPTDSVLVAVLKFAFYLTLPATMIITVFALMAVVDSFSWVGGALQSEDNRAGSRAQSVPAESGTLFGENDREHPPEPKGSFRGLNSDGAYCWAVVFRVLLGLLLLMPLLAPINEYVLILLTGSLVSPCLGFVFPILGYNYYFREELKAKPLRRVANYLVLILGISVNAASFAYTLKNSDKA